MSRRLSRFYRVGVTEEVAFTIQPVTIKERLHKLVDELSDAEADDALRYVASRREGGKADDFAHWLDSRPEDDEPLTAEDEEAIAAGDEDIAAGRLIPFEEIKRKYGYR